MSESETPAGTTDYTREQGHDQAPKVPNADAAGRLPGERTLVEGLLHYLGIILRYKWLVLGITAAAAIGSVVYALISLALPPEQSPLPNYYEANAVLLQQRAGTTDSVSATIMSSLGVEPTRAGIDYGQIALAVLNSRDFIDRIVDQNRIVERYDIRDMLRTQSRRIVLGGSRFSYNARTGMLEIAYQSIDPEFAAQMVDSFVNELIRWFATRVGTDRLLAVQTMEEKMREVEERIHDIESEIEEFQLRYGVLRVEEIAQTQTELISGLQSQLLSLDLQISNRQEVSRIEGDPQLLTLRSQRQNILNLMARIRSGYTGGSELLPPREQLPALAAEYARLQMDRDIQARIYQALTERYEVARLTADTDPAFTVLVPVEVPEEKSGPRRSELVMTATGGGFLGSIVLALLIHGLRVILRDPEKRRLLKEAKE